MGSDALDRRWDVREEESSLLETESDIFEVNEFLWD